MIHLDTIQGFLLGVIATSSLLAGLFFLRFWRDTRDTLFLNFALAFIIEGVNRTVMMFYAHPNEASPWVYIVRSFAFLLIVAAIVKKNRPSRA
ncbi:MAG: DUF5985 family protein [Acidobacteriaceae bacterium]